MVSPAAQQLADDFGITSTVMVAMTISIFVLAYGTFAFFYFIYLRGGGFNDVVKGSVLWREKVQMRTMNGDTNVMVEFGLQP